MKLLIFCLIPSIVNSIGDYKGYFFQDNLLPGSWFSSIICVSFTVTFREIRTREWLCHFQHGDTDSGICKNQAHLLLAYLLFPSSLFASKFSRILFGSEARAV